VALTWEPKKAHLRESGGSRRGYRSQVAIRILIEILERNRRGEVIRRKSKNKESPTRGSN